MAIFIIMAAVVLDRLSKLWAANALTADKTVPIIKGVLHFTYTKTPELHSAFFRNTPRL